MPQDQAIEVLNRLLAIHCRSLAMYLVEATQSTNPGDPQIHSAVEQIVADQKANAQRIAALIEARGGTVYLPPFPMEFTDTHFVAIESLVQPLVQDEKQAVAVIEDCLARLAGDREAATLAQETLGAAKAHLESLEQFATLPA